jgi:hypothetical protein
MRKSVNCNSDRAIKSQGRTPILAPIKGGRNLACEHADDMSDYLKRPRKVVPPRPDAWLSFGPEGLFL